MSDGDRGWMPGVKGVNNEVKKGKIHGLKRRVATAKGDRRAVGDGIE